MPELWFVAEFLTILHLLISREDSTLVYDNRLNCIGRGGILGQVLAMYLLKIAVAR